MVSSLKVMILMIATIMSLVGSRMIPHRDNRYKMESDCDKFKKVKNSKDALPTIIEAQDCFDYNPESGFQCCYVDFKADLTLAEIEKGPFCMIVHSGNETDFDELKTFVSTKGLYATVTCSSTYITMSFLIALLFLLA